MALRERAPLPRIEPFVELFAKRERPHMGADLDTARKFVGMIWGVGAALTIAFLAMAPPTDQSGVAGWPTAVLIVALSAVGSRWVMLDQQRAGFNQLLMVCYLGLAQTALLQWLAGGASPYRALFLLWLGAGVATNPPRRGAFFIASVVAFGSLPLAYSHAPHTHVDIATDALLWVAMGSVMLLLIERVRSQRAQMQTIEEKARARAEEAVKRVQGLEAVADAALAHLPFDELLSELLNRVSRVLEVERAAILLRDEDRDCLTVRAARGGGAGSAFSRRVAAGEGIAGRATQEKRPVFVDDLQARSDIESVVWEDSVRSVLAVPLLVDGGRVIGVLQVGTSEGRTFTSDDAQLLQLAADRLAVAIDRARLNEHAHHIAAALQRSLLPSNIPEVSGLALSHPLPARRRRHPGRRRPLRRGPVQRRPRRARHRRRGGARHRGRLADGAAAQLAARVRARGRPARARGGAPQQADAPLAAGPDRHAYLHGDQPAQRPLTFASAGHLPPLVCGPDGTARYMGGGEFVPLGVLPFGGFTAGEAVIEPGSTILLYTDGLVEERGVSIEDGLERLRAAIEVAPDDPHAMCDYMLATVPPAGAINDDVALLATRLLPVDSGALELRLPAEPASLALMRRALERWLAAVGVNDDASYEIKVACGEACMNAVEHAYPPGDGDFVVRAINVDGEVEIEVQDFGFWRPPRGNSERGRGLELMRRLMDSIKVVPGPEGTTVHLRRKARSEAFA